MTWLKLTSPSLSPTLSKMLPKFVILAFLWLWIIPHGKTSFQRIKICFMHPCFHTQFPLAEMASLPDPSSKVLLPLLFVTPNCSQIVMLTENGMWNNVPSLWSPFWGLSETMGSSGWMWKAAGSWGSGFAKIVRWHLFFFLLDWHTGWFH